MRLLLLAGQTCGGRKATDRVLSETLGAAWACRLENFGKRVEFSYPTLTRSVTLTGQQCGLGCAHCNGHYLKNMIDLEQAKSVSLEHATSFLISGGCSAEGKVPFLHKHSELRELSRTHRLNFHVGLVTDEEAKAVAELANVVSFDIVGDNDTIREVYGLEATVADYERSYAALKRHCKLVAPHICLGLRGGVFSGEANALEILERHGADLLVFIVLIPTRGTAYARVDPPDPVRVAEFLARSRLRFPKTPIYLGCMRPGGRYRQTLDVLSLRAGVNKIVNPVPKAVRLAQILGLETHSGKECCVL